MDILKFIHKNHNIALGNKITWLIVRVQFNSTVTTTMLAMLKLGREEILDALVIPNPYIRYAGK